MLFGTECPVFDAEFIYAPTRDEVAKILRSSAVFLCPSWEEGFGMPGLEALACGAAQVTCDTKGSLDYARHDETALVVESRDRDGLADWVQRLLEQERLRLRLVENGLRVARAFPTWEQSAARFAGALAALAAEYSYRR